MVESILEFLIHLDQHIDAVIQQYGIWTYALLFAVIFAETGFVLTPFLPGDSMLFTVGALAARGSLNVGSLIVLLAFAAIAGDTVNYWVGAAVGSRAEHSRWINRKHLDRTHQFYQKYGSITIVLARFVPIVRTFAPFVAGVGRMTYGRFLIYNVVGGIAWVVLFVLGGYFFGNLPVIRDNFTLVILAIIVISLVPPVLEFFRHRRISGQKIA